MEANLVLMHASFETSSSKHPFIDGKATPHSFLFASSHHASSFSIAEPVPSALLILLGSLPSARVLLGSQAHAWLGHVPFPRLLWFGIGCWDHRHCQERLSLLVVLRLPWMGLGAREDGGGASQLNGAVDGGGRAAGEKVLSPEALQK
eukprot:1141025-Pelagomonas_calceolata.AAC.4